MGYRFLDHMTDAYIEAEGNTLEEAFENAAKGLVDTMIDINSIEVKKQVKINASGYDLEELLYNWLEEVLLKLSVDRIALKEFKVRIDKKEDCMLEAEAYGEELDIDKHNYKVEIKAVTYHLMEVKEEDGKY
ncbi:MAG: archease, partial [Candidatus Nitrosothermus koennekii]